MNSLELRKEEVRNEIKNFHRILRDYLKRNLNNRNRRDIEEILIEKENLLVKIENLERSKKRKR